ncbi:hypothetical protein PQX77_001390, partial [Marasmius sp. AFHP31]
LLMIYDTVMLIMILIPGISHFRAGGRSRLMKAIYEDGVIYYGLIFLISSVNVVVILALPIDLCQLLSGFKRVMHSTLASRAFLRIRRVASQSSIYLDDTTGWDESEIHSISLAQV